MPVRASSHRCARASCRLLTPVGRRETFGECRARTSNQSACAQARGLVHRTAPAVPGAGGNLSRTRQPVGGAPAHGQRRITGRAARGEAALRSRGSRSADLSSEIQSGGASLPSARARGAAAGHRGRAGHRRRAGQLGSAPEAWRQDGDRTVTRPRQVPAATAQQARAKDFRSTDPLEIDTR
jgi:hypothetical protein